MEKKVLNINGIPQTIIVNPEASLADVLRAQLGLTGTKIGCGMAQCGC
jgi:aldehyde oxidoreductase